MRAAASPLLSLFKAWLAFCWLLAGQDQRATAAEEAAPPAVVRLNFKDAPWDTVLGWVAKSLNLSLQMEETPPGAFTYHDAREFTPEQTLELIHGVLIDRGITLHREAGLLVVLRLADQFHMQLAPHVALEQIDKLPAHQMVTTTLKLYGIGAHRAATELTATLSPRGHLSATQLASRLVVCDRVSVIRQLRDLLATIDPPSNRQMADLRVFVLRHADATTTARVLREATGMVPAAPAGDPSAGMVDFSAMGRQLGNRQMAEAFIPGLSLQGIVPDAPKPPAVTRIAVDRQRNSILVSGVPQVLASAARIVASVDVEGSKTPGDSTVVKSYQVDEGKTDEVARQIGRLFETQSGFSIAAAGSLLVARGTAEQHQSVAAIVAKLQRAKFSTAVFPVSSRRAETIGKQLAKLFESVAQEYRPKFYVDAAGGTLIVRATDSHLEQVRRLLFQFGERDAAFDDDLPRRRATVSKNQ